MNTPVRLGGPLVGMHFRPPAPDVVNVLPSNCPLILQRQPENQYDTNAVQVLLPGFSETGHHCAIFMAHKNEALDDPELLGRLQDPLFLGFIANSEKTGGKKADPIAKIMDDAGLLQVKAWLTFNAKGFPVVETDCQPVTEGLVENDPSVPDHALSEDDKAEDAEFDPPQPDHVRFPQD